MFSKALTNERMVHQHFNWLNLTSLATEVLLYELWKEHREIAYP